MLKCEWSYVESLIGLVCFSQEYASDINLALLKENVEVFMKKEANFKRPPKPETIFNKLTKNFLPNHEW